MTSNMKIGLALAAVAAGVGVFLYTRRKPAAVAPSGSVLAESADRETYYGGSGRCFQTSDDLEVPAQHCTDRGIPIGLPSLPKLVEWLTGGGS